ncbi:MAG: type III pantothenate kinase [candidate division KSB1 bacterium]|nr:type III pantothenate kinase [candidate division KSB1 bacterium]MDZ7304334.1 type III pantothenate kinase [candidate division KSB1 bacterium]MDZ7313647.1 type III pantothenate kinase [candidate division KSB1 bacterium]
MLLVADIGNTNITFGLFEQDQLRAQWRLSSGVARTDDEIWILIKMLLESEGFNLSCLNGFALSSVVPNLTPVFERVGANRLKVPMVNVTAELDTGIKILYENPQQVGADRICNAVAGFIRYGGPLVVVDFGTATTFDVITEKGEYLGGIIAPGPETTAEILHRAAAKLPKIALRFPPELIGRNTETSMQSGLMFGGVEMVEGLNRRLKQELGAATKIIATGGLASVLVEYLTTVDSVEPALTLEGLRLIFERCAPRG